MTTLAKVPCTIVTGFLGAGKTTLVRHVLENAGGRRLAVIVNEFGDVGIDGEILKSCGIESCAEDAIVELANGCICCTVADDWPEIASRVTVDGVVAVVDGAAVAAGRFADDPEALARQRAEDQSLDHDNPLEEVFEDQLACADLVVLNKRDLVDEAAAAGLAAGLSRRLRPGVKLLPARFGAVDPAVLLGLAAAAEDDLAARPSHADLDGEHDHDDFASFVVAPGPVADPAALAARLQATIAAHDILRVKGFLDVPGKAMRLALQGVGPRIETYYDRPWRGDERRTSALVVIGRTGLDRDAIAAALAG
ncbi:MAG: GTP-binding protein [Rhodospirillales bacterium]|nr:GTP-binding protein [Rhodospirillales bacterium]